jgi:hypothetical protein
LKKLRLFCFNPFGRAIKYQFFVVNFCEAEAFIFCLEESDIGQDREEINTTKGCGCLNKKNASFRALISRNRKINYLIKSGAIRYK